MLYYAGLPMAAKGTSLTALHLSKLDVQPDSVPLSVSGVPGTSGTAAITLKSVSDGSRWQLLLKFANGKLTGSNVMAKKSIDTVVTGCKNTDDQIVVEQVGAINVIRLTQETTSKLPRLVPAPAA